MASGFLLHFLFSWTGESKWIAWFVPVNESVWEHLKLGYWSVVLFSMVEYPRLKVYVNNYFLARFVGIILFELTILGIFYSYTLFTGENIVLVDIASYLLGGVVCQYVTYAMFRKEPVYGFLNQAALALILALGILFAVTTWYPPHHPLFEDHNTHTYGLTP
jgi:hypothetical protein